MIKANNGIKTKAMMELLVVVVEVEALVGFKTALHPVFGHVVAVQASHKKVAEFQ